MPRYTPDSYDQVMQDWMEAEGTLPPRRRNVEELKARRIGDAERIAITLLDKALKDGLPTFMVDWVKNLVNDTAYAEHAPVQWFRDLDNLYNNPDQDERPFDDEMFNQMEHAKHEAIIHLGSALVNHRLRGEPDIDTTTSIGWGIAVTTSLAAAICEYHNRVCHAYGAIMVGYDALKRKS